MCIPNTAEFGMKKVIVTYETQEQAQRAVALLGEGDEHVPRVSGAGGGVGEGRGGREERWDDILCHAILTHALVGYYVFWVLG